MDTQLLRTILEKAPGFRQEDGAYRVAEGYEVSVNLAVDGMSSAIERVREIRVEHGFVTLVTSDHATTTYADAESVASVSVRGSGNGEKKRPGFS